ncbi:MAG: hypothetical protein JXA90_13755 [Planctomycetes bacterium]|nr:hypothetical protein [Planctomycetota bacterium]
MPRLSLRLAFLLFGALSLASCTSDAPPREPAGAPAPRVAVDGGAGSPLDSLPPSPPSEDPPAGAAAAEAMLAVRETGDAAANAEPEGSAQPALDPPAPSLPSSPDEALPDAGAGHPLLLGRISAASRKIAEAREGLARGEKGSAEQLVDEALDLHPANSDAVALKARLLRERGGTGEALRLLESFEEPGRFRSVDLVREQALATEIVRGADEALEYLRRVQVLPALRCEVHFLRAEIQATAGRAESAISALHSAAETGFRDVERILDDERFEPLKASPRFRQIAHLVAENRARYNRAIDEREVELPPESMERIPIDALLEELAAWQPESSGRLLDFELPQIDGGMLRAAEFRGRPLAVLIWAHWSSVSGEVLGAFERTAAALEARDLAAALIAVDYFDLGRDFERTTRESLEAQKILIRCGILRKGLPPGGLAFRTVPTILLVDPAGEVRLQASTAIEEADLRQLLEEFLGSCAK